jgi:hypothetical protein
MGATKKPRKRYTPRPAVVPRAMRPRLDRSSVATIGLMHIQHLDAIATGKADVHTLMDLTESVFTWSRVSELLQVGVPEMHEQLELVARLLERYIATRRIVFTGVEYQLAKEGVQIMDALAAEVDLDTANEAAMWSTARLEVLKAQERLASLSGETVAA